MTNLKVWFSNKIVFTWSLSILTSLIILGISGIYYASQNRIGQTSQKTTIKISGYRVQPDDLKPFVQNSFLVVEGIVKEVKPSVWTTPNNLAPANTATAMGNPDIQLRTPVLISITRTIKGDMVGDLLFTMVGGEYNDYKIEWAEADPAIVAGDRIVVFLNKAPKDAGPWANISPYYPEFYFLVTDDKLVGFQKTIQRSEFENQLRDLQETK